MSDDIPEGNHLPVLPRDLGSCELYPQMLMHICKGCFVAVCGDGEFIIYLVQSLHDKEFGQLLEFLWLG
eukprot:13100233-Ditylum_brightwellii.AAC.1